MTDIERKGAFDNGATAGFKDAIEEAVGVLIDYKYYFVGEKRDLFDQMIKEVKALAD